ncbi:MAG: hypothetical protein R2695_16920 [Acidimicrobiales bacterium]
MATDPVVRQLTIRVYVVDWAADAIPTFHIERLDRAGDRPAVLTVERAATALDEAAHWIETSVPYWLRYIDRARPEGLDNQLFAPGGAKGGAVNIVYGAGYWQLRDDEAWLITFERPDAFHWSIQTHTWPWFESGDLAHATTSLNDQQAHVDADGTVRVVVSAVDPGVPNWIDTEGRPVGMVAYRWIWARTTPTPTGEVVALTDLAAHLPDDHPSVGPAARRGGARRTAGSGAPPVPAVTFSGAAGAP